jgi:transcriptional regulator with XRE-family HTH domain
MSWLEVPSTTTSIGDSVARKTPRPVDVLVGQNIRLLRLRRGLSQTELGRRIGLTFQQIQKYEKGANRVGAARLAQLADALGVSLTSLFDGRPTAARTDETLSAGALLTRPHSMRLVQAFDSIEDKALQLTLLQLIESVGEASARGKRSGNGRNNSR